MSIRVISALIPCGVFFKNGGKKNRKNLQYIGEGETSASKFNNSVVLTSIGLCPYNPLVWGLTPQSPDEKKVHLQISCKWCPLAFCSFISVLDCAYLKIPYDFLMLFPLSSERAFLFLHNTFAYRSLSNEKELDEK